MCSVSECLLYVPDECAETEERVFLVQTAQTGEQRLYTFVVADGYHRLVHCRPGMGTEMRLAGLRAASSHCREQRVSAAER